MNSAIEVANAYQSAPIVSPGAREAYALLARYLRDRFAQYVAEGWTFVDDYTGDAPNLEDVRRTKTLPVYNLNHAHPILTDRENWLFRAVHDVAGHASAGFGLAGEVEACRAQIADFDVWSKAKFPHRWPCSIIKATRCAIFSEIVGQASYFDVHGSFPVQKAALLWSVFRG